MRFESPYYLLLLLPLAGLFLLNWRRRAPSIILPSIRPALESGAAKKTVWRAKLPLMLDAVALALMIVAIARPQRGMEELKQRAEGIDIILALDLSGSMKAIDVPPSYRTAESLRRGIATGALRERAEVAKEEIRKFIERRPNDRIGLIAFAPLPYLAAPPTLDRMWIERQLAKLDPGELGDATGIAGPIATATTRLKDSKAKRRVLVLFTDGKNNVDARITPMQAAKIAKDFGIVVHTVGIGSQTAFVLVDSLFGGKQLQQVSFEFDEKLLREVAEATGGRYFAAKDAEGLEKTMQEIDRLEKTSFEEPKFVDYREIGLPLISASLVVALASILLSNSLLLKIP